MTIDDNPHRPNDPSNHIPTRAEFGLMVGFPPPADRRVTKATGLWSYPHNLWANQHMRWLLPSAGWAPSSSPVELPRRIEHRLGAIEVPRPDGTVATVDDMLAETHTDSFVVVHRGTIVGEWYFNGMTSATPHMMMSCTKSFIGVFALGAVASGVVCEDARVGDLIPELDNGGAFADATVGQVLDMTSSMDFNEDYADPTAQIHEMAFMVGLGPGTGRDIPQRDIYEYIATLRTDPGVDHGEMFRYQGPSTDVVNLVTNRSTGVALIDDFAQLWNGLGCTGEAYMLLDPAALPISAGGLNITPLDTARFGAMIVNGGRIGDRTVVDRSVIDTIRAGGSTDTFLAGPEAQGFMATGEWSYRALWWVRHTPGREAIVALGTSGQWIYCDVARELAIVKHGSQPQPLDIDMDEYILRAIDSLVDALE